MSEKLEEERKRRATDQHMLHTENRLTRVETQMDTVLSHMESVTRELHTLNNHMSGFIVSEPLLKDMLNALSSLPNLINKITDIENDIKTDIKPKMQLLRDDMMKRTGVLAFILLVGTLAVQLWKH